MIYEPNTKRRATQLQEGWDRKHTFACLSTLWSRPQTIDRAEDRPPFASRAVPHPAPVHAPPGRTRAIILRTLYNVRNTTQCPEQEWESAGNQPSEREKLQFKRLHARSQRLTSHRRRSALGPSQWAANGRMSDRWPIGSKK